VKVGLGFRGRLRGDLGAVGQEIDLTHQALRAWQESEHDVEGGHTDITATGVDIDGPLDLGGPFTQDDTFVYSPPQIVADQNDYAPPDLSNTTVLRLQTDASRTITGIKTDYRYNRYLRIINVGNFDLAFSHNSSSSTAVYRIACPLGTTLTLASGASALFFYDIHAGNWRVISVAGSATGGFSSSTAVTDGDKGDITVSSSGATWDIDADVVGNTELRDSGALSVIGRSANSTGNPADISASAASGAVLRESGSTLGFGTVATAGIADAAVTYAKIQDVSATQRVLGRNTSGSGDVEEVTITQLLDWTS